MKSPFWELWKNEFKNGRYGLFIALSVFIAWDVFLYTRLSSWNQDMVFGLSFVPIVFLPIYALISGFSSFRQEWSEKRIPLLLSLPVRGTLLTGVKLLSIFIDILIFTTAMMMGVSILALHILPFAVPWKIWFQIDLIISLVMFLMSIISQFAFLAGRMVHRFQWLVSLWVFLLSLWGLARFASLMTGLIHWLPAITIQGWQGETVNVFPQLIRIESAPIVSLVIGFLILYFIESWFLEKCIEK